MTDLLTPTTADRPPEHRAGAGRASRRRWIIPIVAGLVAIGAGLAAVAILGDQLRPHLYAGTVLQGNEPAPSLDELSYPDGTPVDLAAHRGEVVLVFFGYSRCPDVCPTTLAEASGAVDRLDPGDAERTNLVMVSVDPERDDATAIDTYARFFHPDFRGAAGPVEAIDRAASTYGVYYRLDEPDADGHYLVDHTSTLMGIGPDGAIRVIWSSGVGPDALAADIEALLS